MSQPTSETSTTTPPGGQDTSTTTSSTPPTGEPNTGSGGQKTFTQGDVDRLIDQRFAKVKAQYADYDQLKERAEQWDTFVNENRSEQEKALEKAKKDAEKTAYDKARTEFGSRLVDAHLVAAAAGRLSDTALAALLAGVNKTAFLTETGDIDTAKVTTFIDGIAPKPDESPNGHRPGGFGQGPRVGQPKAGLEAGAAVYEARHAKGAAAPLFT
jgi:hypothetical protein